MDKILRGLKQKATCVAALTKKKRFLTNLRSNRQLEAPLLPFFSLPAVRHPALAQKLSIDPKFRKAEMAYLGYSQGCGKATAVPVPSFEANLVAKV